MRSGGMKMMILGLVLAILLVWTLLPGFFVMVPNWFDQLMPIVAACILILVVIYAVNIFLPKTRTVPTLQFSAGLVTGLPMTTLGNNWDAIRKVTLLDKLIKIDFEDNSHWQHEVAEPDFSIPEFEAFCWACIAASKRSTANLKETV